MRKQRSINQILVNMYNFDTLIQKTVEHALWLKEYFRLNFIYYQLVSGKGLEFDKIREYYVGADPRRIDWKKNAKTGQLYVRTFKEERQFDVVVIMDVSDSMLLGTTKDTKNEFAAMIAGTLLFAAYEAGDDVGAMLLSDKVEEVIQPSGEFVKIISEIADKKNYGGEKAWHRLLPLLSSNFGQDSILFIVSDFLDTNVEAFLPELSAHFAKVYGIMVRDPIDLRLPKGVGRMYLQDTGGKEVLLTNLDKVREEYELINKRKISKMREVFHEYNQLFFQIEPGQNFGQRFVEALGAEEVDLW